MVMGFRAGDVGRRASMTYFVSLRITAIIIGLLYLATHLPYALAPVKLANFVRGFPRNYPLGIFLMLAATLWFTVLTGVMDLGEISNMRMQLCAVWAVSGILVVIFVPGFLAVRGFGCLLLLASALVLDASFLTYTIGADVIKILAYIWAIVGMVLVYSPHLGRDAIAYITATPGRFRAFAWPGAVLGVVLIALGIFVYP
jgi:hypothetical protein